MMLLKFVIFHALGMKLQSLRPQMRIGCERQDAL